MTTRNDLTIYDTVAADWWSDDIRWVRTLRNLVPGRLRWMDRQIDWQGRDVLDLGIVSQGGQVLWSHPVSILAADKQ